MLRLISRLRKIQRQVEFESSLFPMWKSYTWQATKFYRDAVDCFIINAFRQAHLVEEFSRWDQNTDLWSCTLSNSLGYTHKFYHNTSVLYTRTLCYCKLIWCILIVFFPSERLLQCRSRCLLGDMNNRCSFHMNSYVYRNETIPWSFNHSFEYRRAF